MTSNAPWSVKGIERDARETAKAAAQREGMTLGEWLNQMIYSAGDPNAAVPPANDVDGLKARDIAAAFEHLTRRIAGAEARSTDAVESLARSLGGVVERLQRMERARNPGETPPDLMARVETLEAKAGDRTRIDALRALEKAVSQVAQQFAAAQSSSLSRLDAVERTMQTIASRLDTPAADVVSADALRDAFEQLAGRIERAERVAEEAVRLKADAGGSTDADFVQKTGLRLRILGDEIKRGGDQIKTLESSIARLGQQIDAAERRSAEGVQKVAETISELRAEVAGGDGDHAGARAEIEAAVSEITQRTEDRITALQRSFDEMVRRLDGSARTQASVLPAAGPAAPAGIITPATPPAASPEPAPQLSTRDALDDEFDSVFAGLEEEPASEEDADDLDFELAEKPAAPAPYDDETGDVLAEIREAFGIDPPTPRARNLDDEEDAPPEAEESDFDAEDAPPVITAAELKPELAEAERSSPSNPDYIKAARIAAREAAARAAAEADGKRKLTPKQRAILAARARRRRLEEETSDREGVARDAAPLVAEPAAKSANADAQPLAIKSRISAAIAKLKKSRPSAPSAAKQGPTLDEAELGEATAPSTSLAGGAAEALKKFRALPMSGGVIGLGVGIVLLGVALFVLTKDLLAPKPRPDSNLTPADPISVSTAVVPTPAPAVRDSAPADDLVRPRELYLQNITALKSAETDAQAKAALAEIEKAAALGHPPAQLQLGELYKIGQIYPKDLASARQWFERAANGGNVLAMHRLGVMSARGEGGPIDPAGSIAWFEKAAAFGLLDSQYNLGATYHPTTDGQSTGIQNAALAYYWYSVAAKNGDAQAAEMAAGLAATLSPAERAARDAEVAAFSVRNADPIANELAPAS